MFFSFIILSMSCHSLLAWRVSVERSAVILMGILLCIICYFSLAAFNSCSLCLIFVNLINMYLGVFCFGFIMFGTLGFLDLGDYFLSHCRELFIYYLLKYFLMVFLFSSSGTPMTRILGHLTLSQRSLRLSSFLLILFFFFSPPCFIYFYNSIFYLTYPIFC